MAQVEATIEEQMAKEKRLKMEVAKKKKQVDENERLVCQLKQKHSVICSALEAKRKIFDRQLRQKHQTKEKVPEEREVSASCVTVNACFAIFPLYLIEHS